MFRLTQHTMVSALVTTVCLSGLTYALTQPQDEKQTSVFAAAREKARDTACLSNLKQLGTAVMMYAQDYDETLPMLTTRAHLHRQIYPYVKNNGLFTCPASKEPYKINRKWVDKTDVYPYSISLAAIAKPAKTILMYDPKPHADGSFGVMYADGMAKREPKLPPLNQGMR
jgi:hypothetical protein